jgi:hypothetical protein
MAFPATPVEYFESLMLAADVPVPDLVEPERARMEAASAVT